MGMGFQEEREFQAQEAFERVEEGKKAGVYTVLKKIEVWQTRCGRRLSDAFNGGGERVIPQSSVQNGGTICMTWPLQVEKSVVSPDLSNTDTSSRVLFCF